jgi:hypothetical protein
MFLGHSCNQSLSLVGTSYRYTLSLVGSHWLWEFRLRHLSAPEEFEGQVKKLLAGGNFNDYCLLANIIIITDNIGLTWRLKG